MTSRQRMIYSAGLYDMDQSAQACTPIRQNRLSRYRLCQTKALLLCYHAAVNITGGRGELLIARTFLT